MQPTVSSIYNHLINSGIVNQQIKLTCSIQNITFNIQTRDILGNIIQEWLGNWLNTNGFNWNPPSNSQSFPDFAINRTEMLECKSFNADEGPAFDVANFKSYVDSLLITPQRLLADYIIIPWKEINGNFYINNIYIKNVWKITSLMTGVKSNLVTHQVKKGVIYNIRPSATFYQNNNRVFQNRKDFVSALSKTIDYFSSQIITQQTQYKNGIDWFNKYATLFQSTYNQSL